MGLVSVLWGIVALCWMMLALVPVLHFTNLLLVVFAGIGVVIAALGILFSGSGKRGRAKAGLIINALVIVVAIWRFGLFGGWF